MLSGLLPIGSVVLLRESTKRVMIIGFVQRGATNPDTIWDYCGVIFPEGFLSPDTMILFNNEQIDRVFALGYQDEEQQQFKTRIDATLEELRGGE